MSVFYYGLTGHAKFLENGTRNQDIWVLIWTLPLDENLGKALVPSLSDFNLPDERPGL